MKTSKKMLFMIMTIMSTLMIMSSSNWMNMWVGMEINLMSFIPLMSESKNPFLSESSMMYFLIQSMASSVMIMSIMSSKFMFMNMINNEMNNIIMLMMMMKMGMPPFHLWFPEIMNKMKWNMCLMMATWQKIGPLYVLSKIMENNSMNMLIIAMTSMVGAVNGINQTSTRKIMSYSSINHLSWLMMLIMMSKNYWMKYMIIYSIMMMITCNMMYNYNMMFINQMKTFSKNILDKIIITTTMMSLGGLPPFMGFIPKMMTMELMIKTNEMLIMIIMVISSLVTLSYYMKMSSSSNLMMSSSQKWMKMLKPSSKMFMYMMTMNLLFPTTLLIFF